MSEFKPKLEQPPFSPGNFLSSQTEGKETFSLNRDLLLFNVLVDRGKVALFLHKDQQIADCIPKIIDYLEWLADCKTVLIAFYNAEMMQYTGEEADDAWYDGLEIYSASIHVGQNGTMYAEIATGDTFAADHILDIETEGKAVTSMGLDG